MSSELPYVIRKKRERLVKLSYFSSRGKALIHRIKYEKKYFRTINIAKL